MRRFAPRCDLRVAASGGRAWYEHRKPAPPPRFVTQKVEQRDIAEEVQSTGKVKPLKEVQVGAQVSGRVVTVSVDFNSQVKKGDVLAEIDPRVFGAQVSQTRAQIDAAKAAVKRAEASLAVAEVAARRASARLQQGEPVDARGARSGARAIATSRRRTSPRPRRSSRTLVAQLASAATTLQYTKITVADRRRS